MSESGACTPFSLPLPAGWAAGTVSELTELSQRMRGSMVMVAEQEGRRSLLGSSTLDV